MDDPAMRNNEEERPSSLPEESGEIQSETNPPPAGTEPVAETETGEPSADAVPISPAPPEERRIGRFARSALRWVLTSLIVFALGVAAMYFLRLRPMQAEISSVREQATQTADRLHSTQQDLMASQEREKMLSGQLEEASTERDLAVGRYTLQKIYTSVAVARLGLVNKDGALAKNALEEAREDLAALLPMIPAEEAALGESLKGRLDLVLNELNRDPRVALSDLDIFGTTLQELEEKMFE